MAMPFSQPGHSNMNVYTFLLFLLFYSFPQDPHFSQDNTGEVIVRGSPIPFFLVLATGFRVIRGAIRAHRVKSRPERSRSK